MQPDVWVLYEHMYRSRLFEEAVARIWYEGRISGEMHLSIGEEAVVAGTVLQLQDGDAMALDHRGTSPLVMRGLDMVLLLREFMGQADGLCGGRGGHMHLFSKQHLAASSGIVGASGPAAAGFALAARHLRPGTIALAFFGEGAVNQGMLMEAMNLAVVWKLPILFVCKDSKWAITTVSATVTGGKLTKRAESFGMPATEIDGTDAEAVWAEAQNAIKRARNGKGPSFLLAACPHPEGHFLGDPLLRITKNPAKEIKSVVGPLMKSVTRLKGGTIAKRTGGLGKVSSVIGQTTKAQLFRQKDPLKILCDKLKTDIKRRQEIETRIESEIQQVVSNASQPQAS